MKKLSLIAAALLLTLLLGSQVFAAQVAPVQPDSVNNSLAYVTNTDGMGTDGMRGTSTTNYNGTMVGPGTNGATNYTGTHGTSGTIGTTNYNGITGRNTNTVRAYNTTTTRNMNWSWLGLLGLFGLIGLAGRNRNAETHR